MSMTKKRVYELPIIGLRGSEEKETHSNISIQNKNPEEQKSQLPAVFKGSFSQRRRIVKPRMPFVTSDLHLEGEHNSFPGKAAGEYGRAIFQQPSIPGPIYIVYDCDQPTPKEARPSKYNLKVKHLKKIKTEKSNFWGLGENMSCNLQKKTISTEQLFQKFLGKTLAKCSTTQSVTSSVPPECNKIHREKSRKHLTDQREKVLKSISSKKLSTRTSQLRPVQKETQKRSRVEEIGKYNLDMVAKGISTNCVKLLEDFQVLGKLQTCCEHQVGEQKKPAVKEKINSYIPHCEPVQKQHQWNLGKQPSRCHFSDHQTGHAAQLEARALKSTTRKNLASYMESSTQAQVFHPPRKNHLSALTSQKAPAGTSLGTIPAKKLTMLTRPLPWILPKSEYSMTTDCKPVPTSVRSSTSHHHAAT